MAPTFTSILCHSMLPHSKQNPFTHSTLPAWYIYLSVQYKTYPLSRISWVVLYYSVYIYVKRSVYIWFLQRRSNAPTSKHPPSPHIERCVYETKRTLKKGTFGRHIHSLIYNTEIRFTICYTYIWNEWMDVYINLQGECVIEWYSRLLWGMILPYIRSMYIYDNSRNNTYRCFDDSENT